VLAYICCAIFYPRFFGGYINPVSTVLSNGINGQSIIIFPECVLEASVKSFDFWTGKNVKGKISIVT
jgi:hypothetical protein